MKARLYLDVEFDGRKTDAESIASAMDNVVKTGMSALGDCWDEYGGEPKVGQFLVLDKVQAAQHAEALDILIDGKEEDELGQSLGPVRDFLLQVAGKRSAKTS
jgi:hypothetical protein